jgi:hypothetical protein
MISGVATTYNFTSLKHNNKVSYKGTLHQSSKEMILGAPPSVDPLEIEKQDKRLIELEQWILKLTDKVEFDRPSQNEISKLKDLISATKQDLIEKNEEQLKTKQQLTERNKRFLASLRHDNTDKKLEQKDKNLTVSINTDRRSLSYHQKKLLTIYKTLIIRAETPKKS